MQVVEVQSKTYFKNLGLDISKPLVMGILNITPDSFVDGGKYTQLDKALSKVKLMLDEGADIIDVGGESTNPYQSIPITTEEELIRVIPVITEINKNFNTVISVDTSDPEVMRQAIANGAKIVNDVRALTRNNALEVIKNSEVLVCIMHSKGEPKTMQNSPSYKNVVDEVYDYLSERLDVLTQAGIARDRIIIDPGFGFGKTCEHNYQLLRNLSEFKLLDCPILIGVSRKSMIGTVLNKPIEDRLYGSIAAAVLAFDKGASIIRTHDVKATVDALKIAKSIITEELG